MEYDPVEIFKALSNPSRLEILKFVYESGVSGTFQGKNACCEKCSCMGDIVGKFKLAPSTISHHIKELVRAGLIKVERDGQFIRLLPNPEALEAVSMFTDSMLASAARK
jgi:ArsR family transcriptional regulator, arsenate/arsenite/antimonite-responsive transcriptional repressor